MSLVIRSVLTVLLLWKLSLEVGPWTFISITLIVIAIECAAIVTKRNSE
jgi:hypothetical protein